MAGIKVSSSFDRQANLPIDDSFIRSNNTNRDLIPSGVRYDGLLVYVTSTKKLWQLQGGITNADWKEAGGGVPSGGTIGQILRKLSSTDGDASWQDPPAVAPLLFGTLVAPRVINPTQGINSIYSHMDQFATDQIVFVEGLNSGNNDLSALANQIEAGVRAGQKIRIRGVSSAKYLTITVDGVAYIISEGVSLKLWWTGSAWELDT